MAGRLRSTRGPQLDRLWQSLDLGATGEPVSWAAPGQPASVWLDVAREYSEFWLHQQQVRDGVGRSGANSDRLTWPVADTFLRAGPHALRTRPQHLPAHPCGRALATAVGRSNGRTPPER